MERSIESRAALAWMRSIREEVVEAMVTDLKRRNMVVRWDCMVLVRVDI
jgi:hypothetical protein